MTSPWFLLIFIYAMFIPNTWKRTLMVVSGMAAAPIVLITYMSTQHDRFASLLMHNPHYLFEVGLSLSVAVVASTYGTYNINQLRREVFAARQLGQYRLLRLLGSGGMGEVYLAEHQLLKRPCAIKLIRPGRENDPHALARFEREVQATAKLTHWNTVEIFDYGQAEDGTFYYVMEYLPGKSVAELIEQHGPMPAARVIHLLRQTCDALDEAHASGLIHRDIKPGNLFAAQRGGVYDVAKLLDFGLAKPLIDKTSVQLTQVGAITGSPLFMSPEQASDSEPDARSDIYALGAVAFYMLTGQAPFPGDNPVKLIVAHAQSPVTPPSRIRGDIPRDLEEIVLRCLEKAPSDRYNDVRSLNASLSLCEMADAWSRSDAENWWRTLGRSPTIELADAQTIAVA